MAKLFRISLACLALAATLALPGAVLADDDDDDGGRPWNGGGRPSAAPEIDPGVLRGGLAALAGGMLILADRRRSR